MKRLALAATVALALTALGAGPAAASSSDNAITTTAQAQAQAQAPDESAPSSEDAEDPDADAPVDDPSEGAEDGNESTDPGETTPPADEAADPDGGDEAADDPAEEGADDGTEDAEPIDASFSLAKTKMTAEEIGDPDAGIRFSIDSLQAGDVVNASPGDDEPMSVEEDGVFTAAITGNTELKTGDVLDITVTVERAEQESATFTGSVEVIAPDDDGDEDPVAELTVSPKTLGLQDFFTNGVGITLTNCVVDDEVTFRVSTKADPDTTVWEDSQMAGEDAAGFTTFIPDGDSGPGWIGDFLVMASCGDRSAETTFTVTDDDSAVDPKLNVDPNELSGTDFVNREKGVTMTVTDCTPGSDVRIEVWGFEPSELLYDRTVEANDNGAASVQTYGLEDSPEVYVGTYKVIATCMEVSMEDEFVVTGEGSGGGSDDPDNAGSIPRTGAELTGLGAGALLIVAGAATILFARRRAQLGS